MSPFAFADPVLAAYYFPLFEAGPPTTAGTFKLTLGAISSPDGWLIPAS